MFSVFQRQSASANVTPEVNKITKKNHEYMTKSILKFAENCKKNSVFVNIEKK